MQEDGPDESDCSNTTIPICPHCGALMCTDELYESTERECGKCEEMVDIEVEYTPHYTTRKPA